MGRKVQEPPHSELHSASEPPQYAYSETRQRYDAPAPDTAPETSRRPSARPSAFGLPPVGRSSAPPGIEPDECRDDATEAGDVEERDDEVHDTLPPRAHDLTLGSSFHTEADDDPDEEPSPTLPVESQDLPRAPIAQVLPAAKTPAPVHAEGRGYLRVVAFVLVVAASALPVLRYTGVLETNRSRDTIAADTPRARAREARAPASASVARAPVSAQPSTPSPAPAPQSATKNSLADTLARIEVSLPSQADAAAEVLVDRAIEAKDAPDFPLADALLSRAFKLDEQNPRVAFTLAQLRLLQNDLKGAEGWALVALELRPKRAEYHMLYAEVLDRGKRPQEARHERGKARELRRHR